jgi:hypothetical protein
MQSVRLDALQAMAYGDYFERPAGIGFDALREMVAQTPVLSAVILTRARQVQRFCVPQDGGSGPGFQIVHVEPNHEMTKDEQESVRLLSRFVTNCGWEWNPRRRKAMHRDSFATFLHKLTRETLTYDAASVETELSTDRGRIDGLYALDGSTIRLCSEEGYRGDDAKFAVQVINGQVVTAYGHDDLIYEPRNPRADIRLAGYGLGETELLVRTVTGFLNAMSYNADGFSKNAIPKGILHLVGEYSETDLAAFKRFWNAMVRGVENRWALPVLASRTPEAKATFERLDAQESDMAFAKWMTFLVSIICAVYGMSPAEINFDSFTGGNTSALAGSDTAEKLAASRDSGLRPLLSYFESLISDYILSDYSDKYVFRFTGLDEEDPSRRDDLRKTVLTVNEIRAQEGWSPLSGTLGDAPVNPSLIGPWMQIQQAAQQPDAQPGDGEDGQEGEDGQGDGDDGEDAEQRDADEGSEGEPDGARDGAAKGGPASRDQGAAPKDEKATGQGDAGANARGEWGRLAKASQHHGDGLPSGRAAKAMSVDLMAVWPVDA